MSNGLIITAKKIQVLLKRGCTPEDIMQKYGCTEEEFKKHLERLYSSGDGSRAKEIYKALEANRKKPRGHGSAKTAKFIDSTPVVDESSESTTIKESVKEPVEAPAINSHESDKFKVILELRKEEEDLSNEIIQFESDHKKLSSEHRECIGELRELQVRIEKIKNDLGDCQLKFDEVTARADEIAGQMNEVARLRNQKKMILEKVRQDIAEKSTVIICVYKDGCIEAPENPELTLEDEGFQTIKAEIAEREECLDLRMRDIVTLSRLVKICEKIEHVNLLCDNPVMEQAFWAIRR